MSKNSTYDLIAMGRACLDLYANEVGVPFSEVQNFAAYVGGCPANVAVGVSACGTRATRHWPVEHDRPRVALDTRRMLNILEVDELPGFRDRPVW